MSERPPERGYSWTSVDHVERGHRLIAPIAAGTAVRHRLLRRFTKYRDFYEHLTEKLAHDSPPIVVSVRAPR